MHYQPPRPTRGGGGKPMPEGRGDGGGGGGGGGVDPVKAMSSLEKMTEGNAQRLA